MLRGTDDMFPHVTRRVLAGSGELGQECECAATVAGELRGQELLPRVLQRKGHFSQLSSEAKVDSAPPRTSDFIGRG